MSCPRCGLANGEFYGHVCNDVPVGGMALTFSPTCAKCAHLEAENAVLKASLESAAVGLGQSRVDRIAELEERDKTLTAFANAALEHQQQAEAERDALRAALARARKVLDTAQGGDFVIGPDPHITQPDGTCSCHHAKRVLVVDALAWQAWREANHDPL